MPIIAAPMPKVNKLVWKKKTPPDAVAPAKVPLPANMLVVVVTMSTFVMKAKANRPFYLTGIVVEIIGMEMDNQGSTCKKHIFTVARSSEVAPCPIPPHQYIERDFFLVNYLSNIKIIILI